MSEQAHAHEEQERNQGRSKADWWLLVAGFVIFSALGFWITPVILYASKPQPVQFSHKLHLEQVDEGCKSCHYFREDGSFSGIPSIKKCMECHGDEPLGDDPREKALIPYIKEGKPIPWLVYSRQPDCVFFSHAAHVASAGMDCAECHGDHGKTDGLRPYEYNRISGYSRDIWGRNILGIGDPPDRMKMDDCADCHRENGVHDSCFVCHK